MRDDARDDAQRSGATVPLSFEIQGVLPFRPAKAGTKWLESMLAKTRHQFFPVRKNNSRTFIGPWFPSGVCGNFIDSFPRNRGLVRVCDHAQRQSKSKRTHSNLPAIASLNTFTH